MKLRIRGNSIRLRLRQSEVRRLAVEGAIEETTNFGPSAEQRLEYAIRVAPDGRDVDATLVWGRLLVRIPHMVLHEWASTEQVGIEAVQRFRGAEELRILVEKDFECIEAPAGESQEDAFPRPLGEITCPPAGSLARSK